MKCKFCGYDISETDTKCPGCDKDVTELKNAGNVIYNEESSSEILATSVNDEANTEVEEVKEETSNTNTNVEPVVIKDKFKKKNGLKVFVIIFILLLLILAGGAGYMYFVYTNPVKVAKKMYNDLLTSLPKSNGSTITLDYTNSKLDGYVINTTNYISGDDIISNITVTGDNVMLNANTVKSDGNIYLYENNIYDKYVKFNEDIVTSKDSFRILNLILHRNEFISIIKNVNLETYINSNELTKEYTTITHDQKNMGATKFSYSNIKANSVISKLLTAVRDNTSNLNALAKILNKTTDDTITEISDLIDNINNDKYQVEFDLYTDYLTKSYYKLDINIKNNEHKLVVNIDFYDNKIKDIKVTFDETYIHVTNNMETISVSKNDINTTYTCKYSNEVLTYPILDDAVLYDEVATVIDANISNNGGIKKLVDVINGNVIDEPTEDPDLSIDQDMPELPVVDDVVPDAPTNDVSE